MSRLLRQIVFTAGFLSINTALASPYIEQLQSIGTVPLTTNIHFNVMLPLRDPKGLASLVQEQQNPHSPHYHHWLTPNQVEERFGPTEETIAHAENALRTQGLSFNREGRTLHVSGRPSPVGQLLHTSLHQGRLASGTIRPFADRFTTPEVFGNRAFITGLSQNIHMARTFSEEVPLSHTDNRYSNTGPYWFTDLKQAYKYPSYQTTILKDGAKQRLDGTGTSIGIVMSSDVLDLDTELLFDHEHFRRNANTTINPRLYARIPVNGGAGVKNGPLNEASLDVQEALGGAPGAHVYLYTIPSLSNQNIIDAYARIINDNVVDVVSSSFGECELAYTAAYNNGLDETEALEFEHELFLQGNAQGITFLASSGDSAGLECPSPDYFSGRSDGTFVPSVSYPASDPAVTAVGGTNIVTADSSNWLFRSKDSRYVGENAYSDPENPFDPYHTGYMVSGGSWGAGGGTSAVFTKPDYQAYLNTGSSGTRALPDIGMHVGGCPNSLAKKPCNGGNQAVNGNGNTQRSSAAIYVLGQPRGVIGTSVSSPEFASVVALLVERLGRQGNLNAYIYGLGQNQARNTHSGKTPDQNAYYHQAIPGYNGTASNDALKQTQNAYYNYTVGNGTPVVKNFIGLPDARVAGTPQTASNP